MSSNTPPSDTPPRPQGPRQPPPVVWPNLQRTGLIARRILYAGVIGYTFWSWWEQRKRAKEALKIYPDTILTWKLDRTYITEAQNQRTGLLGALSRGALSSLTLFDAVRILKWAKDDDRVRGLVVDLSSSGVPGTARPQLGFAQVQELRNAINEFKEAKQKKFGQVGYKLVACTDTFDSQLLYYLATAFDEVCMEPVGSLPIFGVGMAQPFLRRLLDRLGIVVRASAVGEYKSVHSMFTSTDFPQPQKENLAQLLASLNDQLITGIANARAKVVQTLMDNAPLTSTESLTTGLIDKLTYKHHTYPHGHRKEHHRRTQEGQPSMPLSRYFVARTAEEEVTDALKIAAGNDKVTVGLVYLVGPIIRGDGRFGSNEVARALGECAADKDVDVVLFRIDSGGGDAVATETIWEAVKHAQEVSGKPVIASYGNMAASGGYYCTAPCQKIIANPGTITGSIGVASARPVITRKFQDNIGVTFGEIYTTKGAQFQSLLHDLRGNALRRYHGQTAALYETFRKRVMDGRQLNLDQVEHAARGRVWTGVQALGLGLVDQLGGIWNAIDVAVDTSLQNRKEKAKTSLIKKIVHKEGEKPVVLFKVYPRPKSFWEVIMEAEGLEDVFAEIGGKGQEGLAEIVEQAVGGVVKKQIETAIGGQDSLAMEEDVIW
ncbi:signal peptide peptidase SppA, 67K type [Spizellomyces punctatus DAOM BR117]|uniref:Signal peptide peptidase SppA, 67K type n=1 Tax=Spizellomyces punctatus (strain DAOM BR117) TaxID=645134 RepID=A0A0L0HI49_SPIPD|nr:signal peptide peptidase SppA, 67K type [Spizellomyces punctatus DAOM BR117]KND00550.1 signal peptide peptidase SppA, 67K type [Spizellomyces punctatus DAOM BR117]|eukprot:XP_016608589.1 signal peptide peptidase SppA, 67K type [Spizellomyces punctatus DAOM BR117]